MPVESYTCPHCDAPLKVNPMDHTASCTYCGAQFHIKTQEEPCQSAPRRRRASSMKPVLQPVLTSAEGAIAYAALWTLGESYLDIAAARAIRWDAVPSVCIAPIFYDRLTYMADYSVDVGSQKSKKVYRNGISTTEKYTDWHTKSGQVHGTKQVKAWGADVSRNELLYRNGLCNFNISGNIAPMLPENMRASVVYAENEPTEASIVKAIGSDAKKQVKQLYVHQQLRYLKVTTPTCHVEERVIARLPLWHVTSSTAQGQYHTYISSVHPHDGIGSYPLDQQDQSKIQKNYRWSLAGLILCILLVLVAIFGMLHGESAKFAWPLLIAAAAEFLLFWYAIRQANQHALQHAATCEEIAEACWNELKQLDKPMEQRWANSLDFLQQQKNQINPSKNPKRPIIFALTIAIAVIGIIVSFRSISSTTVPSATSKTAGRLSQTIASQEPLANDVCVAASEDGRVNDVYGQWKLSDTVNMDVLGWPEIDPYAPIDAQYLTPYTGPADVRLAQYETGTRTPKADLTASLA